MQLSFVYYDVMSSLDCFAWMCAVLFTDNASSFGCCFRIWTCFRLLVHLSVVMVGDWGPFLCCSSGITLVVIIYIRKTLLP